MRKAIAIICLALAAQCQLEPAFALHGEPIDADAHGAARHYGLLNESDEHWARRLNNALVKIDCGDNARSAHLARESDGTVRIYTTWHGVAPLMRASTQQLPRTCRMRFGPDERRLNACRLANLQSNTREDPVDMYRRYYNNFLSGDYAAMFETTRRDWARFEIDCDNSESGAEERAMLEAAALPILARSLGDIDSLEDQQSLRFVAVGALTLGHNNEPRVFSANIANDAPGMLDRTRSRAHNACIFSNYADVGMSGGFLAAIIDEGGPDERIALVCIINAQPPPNERRGQLSGDRIDPDARMMHVDVRNFGAFYPAEQR